ncbi:hypothetical protein CGLO_08476 [Colletotrichum gloeosporioides Cg-14]|nr:hypothetical protein CGLO_08476 [Colletotrichum gloeosporioides Cg-14]
MNTNSVG